MKKAIRSEAAELLEKSEDIPPVTISKADLSGLPEPVQRYLRYAQVIDKEIIRKVYLKQKGFFRTKVDQRWMPMVAEQQFTTHPPAFLWYGTVKPFPLVSISARDLYSGGQGNMLVKFLSTITMGNESGPHMDQGAALRYLAEIAWFPTAWLADYIQWDAVDAQSAKATISHHEIVTSAFLGFNEIGQLTELHAERYMGEQLQQWSGTYAAYQEIDGFLIPTNVEVVWNLPAGAFSYFRGDITEIEFEK